MNVYSALTAFGLLLLKFITFLLFYIFIAWLMLQSGFTPLHIASHYGNFNVAKLLIDSSADVNYNRARVSPVVLDNETIKILLINIVSYQ